MNTSAVLSQRRTGQGDYTFFALHKALALVGLAALLGVSTLGQQPVQEVDSGASAFGQIRYAGNALFDTSPEAGAQQYRALAGFIAKRYKVATHATERFVDTAFEVSKQVAIDPLLLLAVAGVESRFNPIAESEFGAKGLMQIIPRMHADKLEEHGGEQAILDPSINILLGARILKQYIRQTGGLESGLQVYNGALADTSNQYAQKVIAEQERLRQAMRAHRPLSRPSAN